MSEELKLRRLDSLPVKRNITGNEYFVGIDATDILMHIADVKNYFGVSSATSMLGIATPTSMPVSGDGFYIALEAGTYVNFGGVVVNQSSLAVIFAKGGVFTITQTSIGGGYLTDSDINVPGGVTGYEPVGKVESGDKRAVSGDKVEERVKDVIKKSNNLINSFGNLRAGSYNALGNYVASLNWLSLQPIIVDGINVIENTTVTFSGLGGVPTANKRLIFIDISGNIISSVNGLGTNAAGLVPVSVLIPIGTKQILLNVGSGTGIGSDLINSPYNSTLMLNKGNVPFPFQKYGYILNEKLNIAYISPTGLDSNIGTKESPILTFNKAVEILKPEGELVFLNGDYYNNTLDLSTFRTIRTEIGHRARILYGTHINSATLSGGVYQFAYKHSGTWLNTYSLWQHDIEDTRSEILMDERAPVHKGLKYRLPSLRLDWVNSVAEVQSSLIPCYYYDGTTVFFKIKEGTTLSNNPIVIPDSNSLVASKEKFVNHGNLIILYKPVSTVMMWGEIWGLEVLFTNNTTGCIITNNTINMDLHSCRVGGSSNDGYNGAVTLSNVTNPFNKYLKVTFTDCWAHDCKDDAESHHSYCEITVNRGVFEYSGSGNTPAIGCHATYINTISQKNKVTGFQAQGNPTDNGIGTQMHCFGTIARGNGKNYEGKGLDTIFMNVVSIKPTISHFSGEYQKYNSTEVN